MALVVAAGAVSKAAYADPLGDLGNTVTGLLSSGDESNNAEAQAADAFDEYTVQTVSPSGTTINLFDYWVDDRDSADGGYADPDKGINKDHQLDFTRTGTIRLNQWLESSKGPLYNIVSKNLVGGYPELRSDSSLGTDHTESLAYLFNSTEFEGKEANLNVSGLLQQVDGYYEYDSHKNFASYDASTNAFKVYEKLAVAATGTSGDGQFFPFNSADEVFDEVGGNLVAKNNVTSTEDEINHYFGLSMTSRFVQPDGGKTSTGADMVFEFTGDDDVWVFIDDVLVGDVGGIHDASSVSINFVTGDVSVRCANDANAARDWKLDELFKDAGKDISSFSGHTFADGTEHTLKFFYLERGNVDSNMKLKFNLVTVPNSDIVKIDQDGEPIEGAEFALYEANENFVAQGDAIASGTTDASGNLLLTSVDDGTIINFDELHEEAGSPGTMYYLLKETVVPDGYRTGLSNTDDSMHLVYQYSEAAKSGVLTDAGGTSEESYIWRNGAFAGSKETLTAPGTVYGIDKDDGFTADTSKVIKYEDGGTLFAVVLKRTGDELANQESWQAMSGDPVNGYTLHNEKGIEGAIKAAQSDGHPFLLNSSGQYQVELTDLPGDITKYYFMLNDNEKNQSEYTVAVYYTTGSLKDATTGNTERVYSDDFIRQFSARLYVPNIENRLFVQKDDGAGNYLAGAEFSLYKADQVGADGQLIENAEAYDTVWTQEHLDEPSLDGAAAFPNTKPLVEGTYYLKETTAPEGYELNDTLIKVIVDDTGVYAYAGDEGANDGVSTFAGVGKLVKSMAQFGVHDNLDNTLTWIAGTRQVGSVNSEGDLEWTDAAGDVLHLEYGAAGADVLEYGAAANNTVAYPLETESGWLRVGVTQDDKPVTDNAAYTYLGDQNLNALLSGVMGVRVTDEPVSSLEVTKTVEMAEGLNGNPDAEFTFQFDLDYTGDKTYKARVYDKDNNMVGEELTLSAADLLNPDANKIAIKANQTIRVSGLAEGSDYTVTEITDDMPAGYTLTKRTVAGAEYEPDSEGNAITGKIEALAAGGAVNPNNKLGFVNEYSATGTLPISGTKDVTSTNSPWNGGKAGFEFTIDAAPSDTATLEAVANEIVKLPNPAMAESAEDGAFTFSDITFTKPGTYKFQVTEVGSSEPGMSYDTEARIVTVNVAEENANNGNGKLVATISSITYANGGEASLNFVNTYTTQNATSADIAVTKVVTGHDALSAFNFTMKADEDTQKLIDAGGYIVNGKGELKATTGTGITPSAPSTANFGKLEFIKAGTYVFTITEDEAQADWPTGWTYDQHTCTVTITVTDNQDDDNAQLVASVAYSTEDGGCIFANSFATKTTYGDEGALNVTKTLDGRTLLEGEFDFTITGEAGEGTTAEQANAKLAESDKSFSNSAPDDQGIATMQKLSALSFDQTDIGKTYTYVVSETIPEGAVEKDGVFTKDGITFDNKPVTVAIKVLEKDGDIYTETTVTKGGVELGKYSSADEKTAAVAPFANAYSAGNLDAQINVQFTKSFNGWNTVDAFDKKTFEFTITPTDGAPAPENNTVTVGKPDMGSDATFSFGSITFEASHLGGATSKDFVYEVKEVTPEDTDPNTPGIQNGGITYDDHTATVVVTVTDTGTGTLVARVKSAPGLKFTNTYSSSFNYVDAGGLKITKTLIGRDMTDGRFGFTVTPQDEDSADKLGLTEGANEFFAPAAKDGEPATINLLDGKTVTFTQDDAGKTYIYKINETTVGGAGYTNDTAERTVAISVVDNGDATLTVTTTVEIAGKPEAKQTFTYTTGGTNEPDAVVPFVNRYSTIDGGDTSVVLNATKTLTGRDLEDEEFTFQVLDSNKNVITTGTNDVNGKVTFDKAINYTVESLKTAVQNGTASMGSVDGKRTWTIPYTVSEVTDDLGDGVTVVAGSFQVGVAVTDNGDGTLTSKVFYPDGADGLTFENAYGAQSSVKLNINGAKNYDKSDLPNAPEIVGKFTFTLEAKDGGPLPQKDGNQATTATNDAAGNINFGQIEYTMENVFGNTDGVLIDDNGNRYKTFAYTVTESESEPGGVSGVSIDETAKTFTVTITDNGDGSLSYKTDGDFSFVFTNTYEVTPEPSSVTDQITITKELDGREMAAGEFNFELVEVVDSVEAVVAKGTNTAGGTVTFEAIEYTTPGEHNYLVREVAGDKGGVTYDAKTYSIHTSVTDNGNGTLSVKHELEDAQEALFTNTYEADPATVNLGAAKLLNNAKPGDAHFTFQVLDKDGNVVVEAQNNEEGTIQFPELSFDTAGEYEYTIVEANDGQEGVTYDSAEHKIKITVTDNKEGSLVADIEGMDELILFSNTYTEPEGPANPGGSEPPVLPDTSDTFGPLVMGLGVLAVIACAGLVVGAIKMRRKPGAHRSK